MNQAQCVRTPSRKGGLSSSGVCREWEKATLPASQAGIRVVNLRIGIVLAAEGGALQKMLTPFKMGVGGKVGSGEQYMSWITLGDLIGVIKHAITNERVRGPVNAVAPNAVTNAEFTRALGRAMGRPALVPAPAFALRLGLGEMADALLLGGQRVLPATAQRLGYAFAYPQLAAALADLYRG